MLHRFILLCLLSLIRVAVAQEVEGNGKSSGAIFSPADYIEITTPITTRVTVNTYGFYEGNVHTSIALLEVPVIVQKHFVVTPGYMFVNVPPAGLSLLTNRTANQSYHENQVRFAATAQTAWHGFVFSDRNMYVRRQSLPQQDLRRTSAFIRLL